IFFGCCASAMTATASSIIAHRIDDAAAFFIAHLILAVFITDTEAEKSVIYPQKENQIHRGKKG
ncbi:MAG TPA: hypothetical protein VEQ38_24105, partial [Verrucomicrobiae bacterium]|nr:hypothetical protein [Verrucomicrobiae bacterium]